jgi:hypothetical protein
MSSSRVVSLPHEHGGYLTLAGATIAGVAVASAPATALAFGVVAIAAFFARAPLEQLALGRPAQRDRLALVVLVAVGLGGALFANRVSPLAAGAALGAGAAILSSSLAARYQRMHRSALFELAGMGALGASAGVIALVGGAPLRSGLVLALVVGVHTALAIPLVRTRVRRKERGRARQAELSSLAALMATAFTLVAVGAPAATVALVPRALQLALRSQSRPPASAKAIGLQETAALAACVVLLLLTVGAR